MSTEAKALTDATIDESIIASANINDEFQRCLKSLTPREKEVMDLVAQELTNKEVGFKLGISFRTVELHLGRIKKKMNTRNRLALVKKLIRNGYAEA